jgi:hypothetical protein
MFFLCTYKTKAEKVRDEEKPPGRLTHRRKGIEPIASRQEILLSLFFLFCWMVFRWMDDSRRRRFLIAINI